MSRIIIEPTATERAAGQRVTASRGHRDALDLRERMSTNAWLMIGVFFVILAYAVMVVATLNGN